MPLAHPSSADLDAISAAFATWVGINHRQPEDSDWKAILGDDLFHRASVGGFFVGFPDLPADADLHAEAPIGFTVQSGTYTDKNDTDHRFYALLKDGKEIHRQETASLETPDPMAWAQSLGYDVTDHG